jgi:hypothetical protein
MNSNILHANIVLKMGVILLSNKYSGVMPIGYELNQLHTDSLTNGGYWLYDYNTHECYYSDRFIESIGYERDDIDSTVSFFYKTADNEHLSIGFEMISELVEEKSEICFVNELTYYHSDGRELQIECMGTVFYKEVEPIIVLGTHKIL